MKVILQCKGFDGDTDYLKGAQCKAKIGVCFLLLKMAS